MDERTILEFLKEALSMSGIVLILIVSIITGIIVEAIKRTERITEQFLPLLSLGVGWVLATLIAFIFFFVSDLQLKQVALISLSGIMSGGLASGIYDNIRSFLPKNNLIP